MGQKVNPFGFRLGYIYTWRSRWFADKGEYAKQVLEDTKLRRFLMSKLKLAGITKVEIERSINSIRIILHVSRPGVVIGRGGGALEQLKKEVMDILKINPNDPKSLKVVIDDIVEVKDPELQAMLVAQRIAEQLEKRYPHRRAVSQTLERVMSAGARGVKIVLAGRIAGAEISRTEKYTQGSVPTQTLRADIDYAQVPALTKSGYIGVKVWIYKGEKQTK
ncbi:30S ribosomal protein S3 [Patescibacteria group bacterium]|nr:30S ribosomal protein S3 [Patescibacteria group bacterium]